MACRTNECVPVANPVNLGVIFDKVLRMRSGKTVDMLASVRTNQKS